MNIKTLKNLIKDLPDDMEVRLMFQPNYPLEYNVDSAVLLSEFAPELQEENALYFLEGSHIGYGNKKAWHIK